MTLCQLEHKVLVVISQHGVADSVNLMICYFHNILDKTLPDQSLKDVKVCVILDQRKFEFFKFHYFFSIIADQKIVAVDRYGNEFIALAPVHIGFVNDEIVPVARVYLDELVAQTV